MFRAAVLPFLRSLNASVSVSVSKGQDFDWTGDWMAKNSVASNRRATQAEPLLVVPDRFPADAAKKWKAGKVTLLRAASSAGLIGKDAPQTPEGKKLTKEIRNLLKLYDQGLGKLLKKMQSEKDDKKRKDLLTQIDKVLDNYILKAKQSYNFSKAVNSRIAKDDKDFITDQGAANVVSVYKPHIHSMKVLRGITNKALAAIMP